jgi:protein disulfide-isomerase A6
MPGGTTYENVLHLEPADVQNGQVAGVNKPFVLVIYAPWCGHCKNLKPLWEELAAQFPASFLAVDATDKDGGEQLAQMLGAKGFPTILCGDASGKITGPHQGGRDRASLMKSAKMQ